MKTLLIIPAYNEQDAILNTIIDIQKHIKDFDYVVINDGSSDNTEKILVENNIKHITLPVNLGLTAAVQTGYIYAYENGYDCAIQFDGDGQHQARYIEKMIQEIENGIDIVIGSRFVDKKKEWSLRMIGSRIISLLIKLKTGKTIKDPTSGMRMLNRKMIEEYAFKLNMRPEPDTLAYEIKKGAIVKEIQVDMNEREGGISLYSGLWPSIKYMIKMIISIIFIV